MKIINQALDGIQLISPSIYEDNRGSFVEKLNANIINDFDIKQINQSISHKNVFRGFHFQSKPKEQAKYVWVENGSILDIVVNIQPESKQFKKHVIIKLNDNDNNHLLIPRGFAHGFISLTDNTKVCYAVDNYYDIECDTGINFMDKSLQIDWPVDISELLISEKDKNLPYLNA